MDKNFTDMFTRHSIWIDSEGERGEQLVLEDIDIALLSDEQLKLLIDSVLSDCKFADISLIDKDKGKIKENYTGWIEYEE